MGSHWPHWKVQSSLCALAVSHGGVYCKFYFSIYFLISWLFQMASHWSHWKVQSSLCALAVSNGRGSIVSFTFPYIFLLVDCFKWALIGHIEKQRGHSVVWQFWMGGSSAFCIYMFSLCTGISLYFLITWLFRMGSHWRHWTAKSSLSGLAVLNGGEGRVHQFYPQGKSENVSLFQVLLLLHRALSFLCIEMKGQLDV